ncbi:energy transducer TonB [candidate division WOR-3 bacterium]|uniref:Energy transducer TonB n=1 Tax=candidate division WOR-3 bacterium TaxID=2052148 RepID=A0A937XGM8_UNCW3|nr:energy transducer TonB [candidate division WOR-3 bacterium]
MPDGIALRNITIPEDRRSPVIWIAIILSAVVHLGSMFGFSNLKPTAVRPGEDLIQVNVYDITRRPEVAKVVPKQEIGGGDAPGLVDAASMSYTPSGTPDGPTIDLRAALDRGPSQAKIDLSRYELDRSAGTMDLVYLGGKGSSQSTDEILSQPAIALTRAPGRGSGDGRGVPGIPQPAAQLTIERRELAKPTARSLPASADRDLPTVEAPVTRGTNFTIAGPISQREITRKLLPRYPKWALERRVSGTAVVRIWVQPDGQVKGVPTVESSSGYPDLDRVVVDALRGWEFAALRPDVKSEDQWGEITFRFVLS